MNITEYTGLPYHFRTRNCWHHVRNVRADAGINTPTFDVTSPAAINDAFDAGHADTKGLARVETPQNYDAILMGRMFAGRIVWHAGVFYDGWVSHCDRLARQVRLDSLADIQQIYQEIEFWR